MKHTAANAEIRMQMPKNPEKKHKEGEAVRGDFMEEAELGWDQRMSGEWEGSGRKASGEREKGQTSRRLDSVWWHVGSSEATSGCLGSGDRRKRPLAWPLGVSVTRWIQGCGSLTILLLPIWRVGFDEGVWGSDGYLGSFQADGPGPRPDWPWCLLHC